MNIALVSQFASLGGAAKIPFDLFDSFSSLSHNVKYFVDFNDVSNENIIAIPKMPTLERGLPKIFFHLFLKLKPYDGKIRGIHKSRKLLYALSNLKIYKERAKGREIFDYPGSRFIF